MRAEGHGPSYTLDALQALRQTIWPTPHSPQRCPDTFTAARIPDDDVVQFRQLQTEAVTTVQVETSEVQCARIAGHSGYHVTDLDNGHEVQWRNDNPPPYGGPVEETVEQVASEPVDDADGGVIPPADDQSPWVVMAASMRRITDATRCLCDAIGLFQQTNATWTLPDDPLDPVAWTFIEPETPQQRALPRPSTTPPMWARQPNRDRRNRNR